MIKKIPQKLLVLLTIILFSNIKAGYIDNKNLPLWSFPFHVNYEKPSAVQVRGFVITARDAYDYTGNDKNNYGSGYSVSDLWGRYNLARVAKQLELAGYPNPLQDEYKTLTDIPFDSKGRIQSQGIWFGWYQTVCENSFFGLDFAVLNASSEARYCLKKSIKLALGNNLTDSIIWQLYRDKDQVNEILGLSGEQYSVFGISDLDLYLGYQRRIDYCLKLRSLGISARLGTLFPTGKKANVFEPTSISLGAVGKYGIYGRLDFNAELCEDWNIYLWTELLGRTPQYGKERLLVNYKDNKDSSGVGVPEGYAPLVANVKIDPGITFGLGLWLDFAYLRDGWGVNGGYTIIHHAKDDWYVGCTYPDKPYNDKAYRNLTGWDAEWISVGIFHNPMNTESGWCRYLPVFYFNWDIPLKILVANNVPKTNRVSLGFEYDF